MIKAIERNRIIKVLGKQYSRTIMEHLTKMQMYNADGSPYSAQSIRLFVGGYRSNNDVELEIMKLVKATEKRAAAQAAARKNLTQKK